MSIVAKQSSISATAELLLQSPAYRFSDSGRLLSLVYFLVFRPHRPIFDPHQPVVADLCHNARYALKLIMSCGGSHARPLKLRGE